MSDFNIYLVEPVLKKKNRKVKSKLRPEKVQRLLLDKKFVTERNKLIKTYKF